MLPMAEGTNDLFYTRLPVNQISLSDLLMEEHLFFKVPANWHVLITDVKGSTAAVANGLHETVNLVATGSIVAVLNIAFKENLTVPFFFGGDGATFIVPPSIVDPVTKVIDGTKNVDKANCIRAILARSLFPAGDTAATYSQTLVL